MLTELYIRNFAIIDELRLKFHNGFNVLTGETGAGKSIILDAVTLMLGGAISAREYALASGALQVMGRRVAALFQEYDVLLTPTIAQPPAPIGSLQPSNTERRMLEMAGALHSGGLLKAGKMLETLADTAYEYIPYTIPFNLTGQPAMSVPLHWNDAGLPIGMQFAGRFGDEATLFRLAGQLEQARPWVARRPPAAS